MLLNSDALSRQQRGFESRRGRQSSQQIVCYRPLHGVFAERRDHGLQRSAWLEPPRLGVIRPIRITESISHLAHIEVCSSSAVSKFKRSHPIRTRKAIFRVDSRGSGSNSEKSSHLRIISEYAVTRSFPHYCRFTFFRNHRSNEPTRTAERPPTGTGYMWPNAAKPVRNTNTVTPPPTRIKMYAKTSKQPMIRFTESPS